MTLRTRLVLLTAAAVAAAIAVASVAAFLVTRAELRSQVDQSLLRFTRIPDQAAGSSEQAGQALRNLERLCATGLVPSSPQVGVVIPELFNLQFLRRDGTTCRLAAGGAAIPVGSRALQVAKGERGRLLEDAEAGGVHLRVLTAPLPGGDNGAVQLARPLTEVDRTMAGLGLLLGLVAVAGVAISALLGLAVARAGLAPVDRLTAAAEHVARTKDLRALIEVRGRDEIARLARSINAMLTALDVSRRRQRQLVADASHELRTPLTSLRTNIELLARADAHPEQALPARDRSALLADLTGQFQELSGLLGNLLELARDEVPEEEVTEVRLDDLVGRAVERARRGAPNVRFEVTLEPSRLPGRRRSLERAVGNVLDNAVKWSRPGGVVEVALVGGELLVRDHGPGIEPEDLPMVFDRFYRARSARHLPGSGLGLAIVREAVEAHGGTASMDSAPGEGTAVVLRLPAARPVPGG
jgi:two-component system, OmpR family, sensor histidine kinase MprB